MTGLSLHATGDYLLSSSDDQVRSQQGLEDSCWPEHELPGEGTACFGNPGPFPCTLEHSAYILPSGLTFLKGCQPGSGTCFLTSSLISLQYWAFSDIQTGRVLTKVTDETSGCCEFPGRWFCLPVDHFSLKSPSYLALIYYSGLVPVTMVV